MNRRSIQIEAAQRPGNGLVVGLTQRFFESTRQGVPARLLRFDGLIEQRVTPRRFLSQDALRIGELGLVAALRLLMRHDAPEVRVDDKDCIAARTPDFDLALQLGHDVLMIQPRP